MTLSIELWILFVAVVLTALFIDLGLKNNSKHIHTIKPKEAAIWSGVWIALSLAFGGVIYFAMGSQKSLEYLTAYIIEKSLSVDNMFVFIMIFKFFQIPSQYEARVLKWGILGAIIMRTIIIFAGVALINRFHWMMYVFGGLLFVTALKLCFQGEEEGAPDRNPVLRLFKRYVPITSELHHEHFFIREKGVLFATPLFVTLLVVEVSDLIFAVDSIPAVLAVSKDSFIVLTSNIFAILGLRALYFLLAGFMGMFAYLRYGLIVILFFISFKMLAIDFVKVPILLSLGVIGAVLAISIGASMLFPPKTDAHA